MDTLQNKVDRILDSVLNKIEDALDGSPELKDLSGMLRTLYVISKEERAPGNPALPGRYRGAVGSGKNVPALPNPFDKKEKEKPVDVDFEEV